MERTYFDTLIDDLEKKQISLLIGSRQVGKTTLLKQILAKLKGRNELCAFINLENKEYRKLLDEHPEHMFQIVPPLVKGRRLFVVIDEIQYLQDPSNFLKHLYDEYGEQIKFIVSGSSSFYIDKKFKDSLSGRKRLIEISTLTLAEMLRFKGREDLAVLLNQGLIPLIPRDEILKYYYEYLVYGGYPDVVLADDPNEKIRVLKELADSYAKKDAVEAKLQRPDMYLKLLKLLAGRIGCLMNTQALVGDVGLGQKTLDSYLWVLRKSFHIHYVSPFHRNIASELRKMPKVYFNDLGLRNYLMGDFSPIGVRSDRGELLENYAYLLLREMYSVDNIRFWRTQKKHEIDFIVSDFFGQSAAIEIKYAKDSLRMAKYAYFQEHYSSIPLTCLDLKGLLEYHPHVMRLEDGVDQ